MCFAWKDKTCLWVSFGSDLHACVHLNIWVGPLGIVATKFWLRGCFLVTCFNLDLAWHKCYKEQGLIHIRSFLFCYFKLYHSILPRGVGVLSGKVGTGMCGQIGCFFGLSGFPMAPFWFENWFRYRSHFCKMHNFRWIFPFSLPIGCQKVLKCIPIYMVKSTDWF